MCLIKEFYLYVNKITSLPNYPALWFGGNLQLDRGETVV